MVRSNTIVAIEDVKYVNASPIRLEGGGVSCSQYLHFFNVEIKVKASN